MANFKDLKDQVKREKRSEQQLEMLRQMRLFDDTFFTAVFKSNKKCVQLMLRVIIGRNDIVVDRVTTQESMTNLHGRSVRLDVFAHDKAGRLYDIEIQRSNDGASVKRARYNRAMMDANVSYPGEKFENLPETYVIFITENDYMKRGKPMYEVVSYIKETGEVFDDGTHIIYVNGKYKGNDPIGFLINDLWCVDPANMHNTILAEAVRYFKYTEEGIEKVCDVMDEYQARIHAEERARVVAGYTDIVKNAASEFHVSETDAIARLKIPCEYRVEIMELLAKNK